MQTLTRTLGVVLTMIVAACSASYGEEESIATGPPAATEVTTERSDATPAPTDTKTPAPTPKPTTFVSCAAALSTIETCARPEDVMPLGTFASLKTRLRPGEVPNVCVGCDDQPCQMCHHARRPQPVFDYNGVWVPIEWILGCVGQPDGTIALSPTLALDAHAKSVALQPEYSHPFYELNTTLRASRHDAAALIMARLAKGECKP